MLSGLGRRTAARYRRLKVLALSEKFDRPLDALLLSLLLKAERLFVRLQTTAAAEAKEAPRTRRMLVQLAGTAGRVQQLERLNEVMDLITLDCGVREESVFHDWRTRLSLERFQQARLVRRALEVEQVATTADGAEEAISKQEVADWLVASGPDTQIELLTLLHHAGDERNNAFEWTESETQALEAAYSLLVNLSKAIVLTLPHWFVAPSEATVPGRSEANEVDSADGDVALVFMPEIDKKRAFEGEQMVREASLWASLRHPNVLPLAGACHVGIRPYFVVGTQAIRLSTYFRSLSPQVVRYKVFIPMILYEMAMALLHIHDRGLAFSRGDGAGSCLTVDHVYCLPSDDKIRLLAFGLSDAAGPEPAVVDQQQAMADDIAALGYAMADVLLLTQIPRSLSPTLWNIIGRMCQPSSPTLHDVLSTLKKMLWSRGKGLEPPISFEAVIVSPPEEPWEVIAPGTVTIKQSVGEGSFASVHLGTWNGSHEVAIKQIFPLEGDDSVVTEADRDAFGREVALWYQLSHANIVEMYGASKRGDKPFIVCEYASRGNLPSYFRAENRASYLVWCRLLEAARALQYLHRKGIVHGDIKGNNIVVAGDGVAKLIDFGTSFFASEGQPKELEGIGPIRWKAPECISSGETPGSPPSFASDVYSFGMCIIEATSGETPWGTLSDTAVAFQVRNKRIPQRPDRMSESEMALVQRICTFVPDERLSMDYIVRYLECLVERLETPLKVASTPASLRQNGLGISDLLSLASTDVSGFRANQMLDPKNYFLTFQTLRRHPHEWNAAHLRILLPLLDTESENQKLWAARTLGQLEIGTEKATSSAASDERAIASLVGCAGSESPDLQLAAAAALQRLSRRNDAVKRLVCSCGGLESLLTLVHRESASLEVKKAAMATLRNLVAVPTNRARARPQIDASGGEIVCEAIVTVLRSTTDVNSSRREDLSSLQLNAIGALRNLAFGHQECASTIARAAGVTPLLSVLRNGTGAERIEAAGALWNIAAAIGSFGDGISTVDVVDALSRAIQVSECASGKPSIALQEQVVGALNAVAKSVKQRGAADELANMQTIAATMARLAKESESAAVRTLASDCAP